MINSDGIRSIHYFENPHHVFPTVEIRGGVCFLHWDSRYKGDALINNGSIQKKVDLSSFDIIVPHIESYSILEKVINKSNSFLDNIVWPRKPFGLEGNYFKKGRRYNEGAIQCFCEGKEIVNISQDIILKNDDKVDNYKVAFPRASGGGKGRRDKILLKPEHFFILKPGQISTETYSIANSFENKKQAEYFMEFLQTYLARFLLGIRKPTQDTSQKTFAWVPLMDTQKRWTGQDVV